MISLNYSIIARMRYLQVISFKGEGGRPWRHTSQQCTARVILNFGGNSLTGCLFVHELQYKSEHLNSINQGRALTNAEGIAIQLICTDNQCLCSKI